MKEKIMGILGGMGPSATIDFFAEIVRKTDANCDQEHLRIIIDNNPKIPDRTEAILQDTVAPLALMSSSCQLLENAGVHFIVIPCVSSHYFIEKLRNTIGIPIISIVEELTLAIQKKPKISKVGLLATTGTVVGKVIQTVLEKNKIDLLLPSSGEQNNVMEAIYLIKSSISESDRAKAKQLLITVAERLILSGSQGIIAGCTEIPLVINNKDVDVPLFNTLTILAKAAVANSKNL